MCGMLWLLYVNWSLGNIRNSYFVLMYCVIILYCSKFELAMFICFIHTNTKFQSFPERVFISAHLRIEVEVLWTTKRDVCLSVLFVVALKKSAHTANNIGLVAYFIGSTYCIQKVVVVVVVVGHVAKILIVIFILYYKF